MRVVENEKSMKFSDIKTGETFKYEGAYFIKTDEKDLNALVVTSGFLVHFDDEESGMYKVEVDLVERKW